MIEPRVEKVVVVTGASSGIGRSIAFRLAAQGIRVVAGVRRVKDAAELRQQSDLISPVMLDVTDDDSIADAVEHVDEEFPLGIDGLVNNAGVAVAGPVEWVTRRQWQQQYDVNVFGMVSVTQAFLPMLRRRRGRIINISSAASSLALPMVAPYASSKYAIEGLSDSLRRELAPCGVNVVVVCPGQTETAIFAKSEEETQSRVDSNSPAIDYDYLPALTRFQELMHQSESSRRPPTRVARVVHRALTVKHPKRRYHVGWDAHASVFVRRFVPDALVDWLIARQFRPTVSPETRPVEETHDR